MKKMYVILAAVATMLAACNNEENLPVVDEMTDTPVSISGAGVAELTSRADVALTHGSLGLFFKTNGTDDANYNADNREVKYEEEEKGWVIQGTEPLLWKDATTSVTYSAYHPYATNMSSSQMPISVSTEQTAATIAQEDFLYTSASLAQRPANGAIDLTLEHKLAKLNVKLEKGTELPYATSFTVTIGQVACKGAFSPSNQIWAAYTEKPETLTMSPVGTDGTTFEALLIPQKVNFTVTITTADNRIFQYTYGNDYTFESGNAYDLTLRVGKDKVEAMTVSASAWKEDADNKGGNLEAQ